MAQIASVVYFRGTIGNITIDKNGVVRKAQGKRSVVPIETQENNREFTMASRQACLIRQALSELGGDSYISGRLTGVVRKGINENNGYKKGDRFLSNREAQKVLPGFQFYENFPLHLRMLNDPLPQGVTHRKITTIVASLNLNPDQLSVISVTKLDGYQPDADYEIPLEEEITTIVAVGVMYYQEVNGKFVELKGGRKGTIVEVR